MWGSGVCRVLWRYLCSWLQFDLSTDSDVVSQMWTVLDLPVSLSVSVCLLAAGKSTFVRLLQGASDDWEVIPEPIGKWCNIQNNGDIYKVII